jgi:hypothetical protein
MLKGTSILSLSIEKLAVVLWIMLIVKKMFDLAEKIILMLS